MANEIKIKQGTAITFGSNSNTVTFTPKNVANAAGRISAQYDLGANARPGLYRWRAKTKLQASATVGNMLEIYLSTSDGTTQDGTLSTADAAVSAADLRRNLQRVGAVEVDVTGSTPFFQASGDIFITSRYVSVVWWNATGQTLTNTDADHLFQLTPIIEELQNFQ